ncbi:hypothetical protein DSECCO2_416480 [anaerobic digester metagenome]|jgi:hypothetical protein|uniref:Uncharacterized protein n=1 Tax=Methanosarcina mazei (strain ATCC BAA-159 / DSM 3647 / Goe1 / Go1 / JCM 11833 / OCM 88) TaxID=192952 RepID=Q8PVW6_METMA|nr:hypothetical protein MM_1841 [Methanosarcina mazei Go1]
MLIKSKPAQLLKGLICRDHRIKLTVPIDAQSWADFKLLRRKNCIKLRKRTIYIVLSIYFSDLVSSLWVQKFYSSNPEGCRIIEVLRLCKGSNLLGLKQVSISVYSRVKVCSGTQPVHQLSFCSDVRI